MSKQNTYNLAAFYESITKSHPLRYGHQFTVEFIGLSELLGIDTKDLTYYIQSSKIPAVDVNSAKVNFYGAGFEVPGVIKYPDSWDVKILLDQDLTQYKMLQYWMETMSSYRYSQGGTKVIPNIIAKVNLLDNTMMYVSKTYVMEGVWIQKLGNVDFKYEEGASTVATCPCTFTMQYWYEQDTELDPLSAGARG